MTLSTRIAPSPTGLLHVGNAYSALLCQAWARQHHARLLLRIEDIDHHRCKPEFSQKINDDLSWLGIQFQGKTIKQSNRHTLYRNTLEKLRALGVIYPCFCTRKHVQQEIERIGMAPHAEDVADHYPGICRNIGRKRSHERMTREPFSWRLDIAKAMKQIDQPIGWNDEHGHFHTVSSTRLSDTIIGRKDIDFSYHLAVVADDAEQGVSHVIRGEDLLDSTSVHCLLQKLLKLATPVYIHHPLLTDIHGKRLAKRHHSITLESLKEAGCNPVILRNFLLGLKLPVWPFETNDPKFIIEQLGRQG